MPPYLLQGSWSLNWSPRWGQTVTAWPSQRAGRCSVGVTVTTGNWGTETAIDRDGLVRSRLCRVKRSSRYGSVFRVRVFRVLFPLVTWREQDPDVYFIWTRSYENFGAWQLHNHLLNDICIVHSYILCCRYAVISYLVSWIYCCY